MPDSSKVYSWLLRLYPARFREQYQVPMERQFRDEYRETCHIGDRIRLWLHAIMDLAGSAPREICSELARDLKHGLRVYRRRALSAVLAVVALGLAIGISTGVFSVLNALLVRSLPFSDPEELVEILRPPVGPVRARAAFMAWQGRIPYLEGAATFSSAEVNLKGEDGALRVKVAETSANYFQLLGTKPAIGRSFAPDEDVPGHNGVAVISHGLWQQLFGRDPGVLGATLHLNGTPLTVIGIAPARFDYPGKTNIWIPTAFDLERVPKRGAFFYQTIGRLKSGITIEQGREMFEAEVRRTAPESVGADPQNRPGMVSLRKQLAGATRNAGWVLAGMILLLLMSACANVAQLLLSRTTERQQELAIRAALGASRARLLQQLITEATFLTTAGAALGLLVAHWAASIASSVVPAQLATQEYTVLDWPVLGFAAALALVVGVVVGVMPAWLLGRLQPSGQMLRTQPGTHGATIMRMQAGLIALQAGLTITLLASSIALGRTFLKLLDADLGFRPANVVTLSVSLEGTKYRSGPTEWQYYSEALNRLRTVRGVESAGAVSYLPLANRGLMVFSFKLDSGQTVGPIAINASMPGYFRAIGATLLGGRDFDAAERGRSERAVIVNEAFAQKAGLGMAILSRRLTGHWSKAPYVIVGVVSTARIGGPAFGGLPQIYWPVEEEPPPTLTFVARVRGDADAGLAACRDAIRAVDRTVPVFDVKIMEQRLADVLARPRFYTTATLLLAAVAVMLAVVGVYGTAAYSVASRSHEMGVRMALGASHERIRMMMLREGLAPMGLGMAAGIAGALAVGRYLEHLLVSAEQPGLWACAAAAGFLLFTGFLAVWTATARVLAIDPADVVRAE
ncbi:MAG TPA: ADOP family duplicated permease [Bryobacteraceae bacterium]|nr:ADOP family duplicated permease [Bryobacteraceae bacterium]